MISHVNAIYLYYVKRQKLWMLEGN